jgi:hypothetical protein
MLGRMGAKHDPLGIACASQQGFSSVGWMHGRIERAEKGCEKYVQAKVCVG